MTKRVLKRLKIGGTSVCTREHVGEMPDEALAAIEDLPFSQAGPGRHRCAVCAYLLGVQHGEEKAIRKAAVELFGKAIEAGPPVQVGVLAGMKPETFSHDLLGRPGKK